MVRTTSSKQSRSSSTSRSHEAATTSTSTQERSPEKVRPVKEIHLSTVKAAIWANHRPQRPHLIYYTVTVTRIYKQADNLWKQTHTYRRDDLLLLAKVLDAAHSWIFKQQQADREAARNADAA